MTEALSGTQRHSDASRRHQVPSGIIRYHQVSSVRALAHLPARPPDFSRAAHGWPTADRRANGLPTAAIPQRARRHTCHESHQTQSEAIRALRSEARYQTPSKGHQGHQPAITSQQTPSNAPDDHHTQSKAIKGNRRPSEAHPTIARTEVPLAATIEPNGMNDEASPPVASASSWSSSSTSA